MQTLSLKCPDCGSSMVYDQEKKEALCEFCGHRMLIKDPEFANPLNKTEEVKRRLEIEKSARKLSAEQQAEHDRELLRGMMLSNLMSFFQGAKRELSRILIGIAAALFAFFAVRVVRDFYPALMAYQPYLLGAGIALALVGILAIVKSRRIARGLLLGAGIGIAAGALIYLV